MGEGRGEGRREAASVSQQTKHDRTLLNIGPCEFHKRDRRDRKNGNIYNRSTHITESRLARVEETTQHTASVGMSLPNTCLAPACTLHLPVPRLGADYIMNGRYRDGRGPRPSLPPSVTGKTIAAAAAVGRFA